MKKLLFVGSFLFYSALAYTQSQDSSAIFYQKGLTDKNNRLFMVAYNDFQKSLHYKPDFADAERELGLTAVEMKKYEEAIQIFLKVTQLQKDDTTAIANLATLYFWTRIWQKATDFALLAQKVHTGKNWNYIIGRSFYEQEDYGQAFKYLQAAGREDSTNAEIPYLEARGFIEMNNYKPALPLLQRAILLDSSKVQWIYQCALTFATIYDDKSAIKYYELAAERGYKKDNDYYENLSDSYISSGQPEKGLQLMLQVLEKKPADLELLYSVANTYYKIGKYEQAIDYWDKILSFDKEDAKALYMIGMAYQKKGDPTKGKQLCDKAIEMDPSLKDLKHEKKIEM
jgi:tetratricopeptide (TPR) repeat protein